MGASKREQNVVDERNGCRGPFDIEKDSAHRCFLPFSRSAAKLRMSVRSTRLRTCRRRRCRYTRASNRSDPETDGCTESASTSKGQTSAAYRVERGSDRPVPLRLPLRVTFSDSHETGRGLE